MLLPTNVEVYNKYIDKYDIRYHEFDTNKIKFISSIEYTKSKKEILWDNPYEFLYIVYRDKENNIVEPNLAYLSNSDRLIFSNIEIDEIVNNNSVIICNEATNDVIVINDNNKVEIYCYDFGYAVKKLKEGNKLSRKAWNESEFLYYIDADRYLAKTKIAKSFMDNDGKVPYAAYIAKKLSDGTVVPYVPDQIDILAEDWFIVE